ncbi:MAG: hypothetical protein AAGE96_14460 [Cyanobacteria bacterium P01_G01_bin.19]
MTTYQPKPRQGNYDPNYDPRPKTVCIGVSLITLETDSFIQDDRHVEIPVDDDIVYLTVPREIVYLPCGGASYDIIADLLEQEGYLRKHWRIISVWECVPEHIADEIF